MPAPLTAPVRPFGLVAAAKTLAGEAGIVAARTAHQVHGAIGVTMEYPLQRFTRRLWEWSLRDGSSAEWASGTRSARLRVRRSARGD